MRYRRAGRVLVALAMLLSMGAVAGCQAPDRLFIWFTIDRAGAATQTLFNTAVATGNRGETVRVAAHATYRGGVARLWVKVGSASEIQGLPPSGRPEQQVDLTQDSTGNPIDATFVDPALTAAYVELSARATGGDGSTASAKATLATWLPAPTVTVTASCPDCEAAFPTCHSNTELCLPAQRATSFTIAWTAYDCDIAPWCTVKISEYHSASGSPNGPNVPVGPVIGTPMTVSSRYGHGSELLFIGSLPVGSVEFYAVQVDTFFGSAQGVVSLLSLG